MAKIAKKINAKLGTIFYQFAEQSSHVYWIRSADFQSQYYINPAYEKMWGRSCQELYQNPSVWVDTLIVEDRDLIRQQSIQWQISTPIDKVYHLQYHIRHTSGKIIAIRDISMPIFDGSKCIAFMGMSSEETDVLSHFHDYASQFFQFFIEKSDTVFCVREIEKNGIMYINSAYEKVWGCDSASLIRNPESWYDSIVEEDREKVKQNNSLDLSYSHYRITRPNGEMRWIREKKFPMNNENGEILGSATIAEDITDDALREKELREAKENAEQANKSKSDFLAMMSHELRTPLNAILGMAQILTQSKLSREQEGQVEVITQSGKTLLSLLNDILDFTKLEVGQLKFSDEDIDLYRLINQIITDMFPLAQKKNLELTYVIDPDVAQHLVGDGKRIKQILLNLISNAIKYTNQGHVKLKITSLQKNNKETTLCFTVEDTGIGIEKSKIDSIFRRFQQIDSVYQRKHDGVGLGLAIVKELVERMGGSTAVSSELGVGSQFSCIIPLGLQCRKLLHRTSLMPISFSNSRELKIKEARFNLHVLVVEDNKINQKISKMMLEQMGCQVDIAENAQQALSRNLTDYNVIFMDLGLPDMDGFQATQQIRLHEKSGQRIPIVAMTAHVFSQDQERCFQVGMDEVVAKPIMRDDLIAVLGRWAA